MARSWLCVCMLGAGCSFTPGTLSTSDADVVVGEDAPCASPAWAVPYAHRFALTTGGAPVGYTVRVDATAAFALAAASGDDLRVFADGTELDRLVDPPFVEVKVPTSAVEIYVGNPLAMSPPADPANVYLFAESFEDLPPGDRANVAFAPLPVLDWSVVDDAGNSVYRAVQAPSGQSQRHPAAIRGLTLADGDIRARMRINTGGGQQHNGLAARGNNMVQATMDGFVGQLMGDSNRQRIAEYVDGNTPVEVDGANQTVARNTWYAMRLRYVGDNIDLYVDGALVLSATQAGSNGQLVGLYAHDPNVDFDDITVRMAATPEPAAVLGAREDRCP